MAETPSADERGRNADERALGANGRRVQRGTSEGFLFFRNFLKYPNMVGWLLPSSRFVVNDVLRHIDWANAKVILEYGPGLGTFTSHILEKMRADARLIAFEINPEFITFLNVRYTDSRLSVQERSAAEANRALKELGLGHADYIISGIPFRPLSHGLRQSIVRTSHDLLRPGGKFLVYQFSDAILPYLRGSFDAVSCHRQFLNLVPTRLFLCERRAG